MSGMWVSDLDPQDCLIILESTCGRPWASVCSWTVGQRDLLAANKPCILSWGLDAIFPEIQASCPSLLTPVMLWPFGEVS